MLGKPQSYSTEPKVEGSGTSASSLPFRGSSVLATTDKTTFGGIFVGLGFKGDKKGDRAIKDKISAFICKTKHNYPMIPFRA